MKIYNCIIYLSRIHPKLPDTVVILLTVSSAWIVFNIKANNFPAFSLLDIVGLIDPH